MPAWSSRFGFPTSLLRIFSSDLRLCLKTQCLASSGLFDLWRREVSIDISLGIWLLRRPCQRANRSLSGRRQRFQTKPGIARCQRFHCFEPFTKRF